MVSRSIKANHAHMWGTAASCTTASMQAISPPHAPLPLLNAPLAEWGGKKVEEAEMVMPGGAGGQGGRLHFYMLFPAFYLKVPRGRGRDGHARRRR